MKINIKCKNCKVENDLKSENVKEKRIQILNKKDEIIKEMIATCYICPNCNSSCIVQLDDEKTLRLLNEYKSGLKLSLINQGIALSKEIKTKINKSKNKLKQLNKRRQELVNKYNKSFYQSEDIKEQLDICVPDTKTTGESED